jgi:hypothetical protein
MSYEDTFRLPKLPNGYASGCYRGRCLRRAHTSGHMGIQIDGYSQRAYSASAQIVVIMENLPYRRN